MSKQKSTPTLTEVFKDTVRKYGLSNYSVCQGTGILPTSIGRFMRDKTTLRLDNADRLAAYLGLKLVPDPDVEPPKPTPADKARPKLWARQPQKPAKAKKAKKAPAAKAKSQRTKKR